MCTAYFKEKNIYLIKATSAYQHVQVCDHKSAFVNFGSIFYVASSAKEETSFNGHIGTSGQMCIQHVATSKVAMHNHTVNFTTHFLPFLTFVCAHSRVWYSPLRSVRTVYHHTQNIARVLFRLHHSHTIIVPVFFYVSYVSIFGFLIQQVCHRT